MHRICLPENKIENYENYPVGFDPDCCDQNGSPVFFPRKNNEETNDNNQKPDSGQKPSQPQPSGNSNPQVKEQVLRYMEQNSIFRLTLVNGKLVIEYMSHQKEEKEIDSNKLKTIQE